MVQSEHLYLFDPHEVRLQSVVDYEQRNEQFFAPWVPRRPANWLSIDAQEYRLAAEYREQQGKRSYRYFLARKGAASDVIGDVGLSNIVRGVFHSAFLGYKIDKAHQGKGLMREALLTVIALAFADLRLHRLEANIMPHNQRSLALAQSLGFEREGYSPRYLCINGVWEDHLRLALINPAYNDLWLT